VELDTREIEKGGIQMAFCMSVMIAELQKDIINILYCFVFLQRK
jgi:hypothetical protein